MASTSSKLSSGTTIWNNFGMMKTPFFKRQKVCARRAKILTIGKQHLKVITPACLPPKPDHFNQGQEGRCTFHSTPVVFCKNGKEKELGM